MIKPYIVNADISIRDAIEYVGIEERTGQFNVLGYLKY